MLQAGVVGVGQVIEGHVVEGDTCAAHAACADVVEDNAVNCAGDGDVLAGGNLVGAGHDDLNFVAVLCSCNSISQGGILNLADLSNYQSQGVDAVSVDNHLTLNAGGNGHALGASDGGTDHSQSSAGDVAVAGNGHSTNAATVVAQFDLFREQICIGNSDFAAAGCLDSINIYSCAIFDSDGGSAVPNIDPACINLCIHTGNNQLGRHNIVN